MAGVSPRAEFIHTLQVLRRNGRLTDEELQDYVFTIHTLLPRLATKPQAHQFIAWYDTAEKIRTLADSAKVETYLENYDKIARYLPDAEQRAGLFILFKAMNLTKACG